MPPPEPPQRDWWLTRRLLPGVLGVLLLAAAATYVVVREEVGRVVSALGQNRPVKLAPNVLVPTAGGGAPQTLLLVGNDQRPPPRSNPYGAVLPHSNEMLLVRIDPSRPTISMLSIPRELRVTFTAPNGETITNRINSAYTYGFEDGRGSAGAIKLMLETIKRVTGIAVNHVFVTDFPKFRRAVDEMGCVYMTVDKRYHHVNEPGGEQYFEINLQPGYQRLCGPQALEFVANRHESTSLIRDARDQRFLLAVKAQYGSTLFENREKFERILGKAIETDLHGEEEVLALLELLIEAAGKPVRQVPFQVELHSNYDTATPQQLHASAHSFLAGTAAIPAHSLNRAARSAPAPHPHHGSAASALALSPTPIATLAQARALAARLPFALQAPQYQLTTAEAPADELHSYRIQGPDGHSFPAYVLVVARGELGQYYDVQGSTWTDPPLLGAPSQEIHIGSRAYSLYYDGEHIKTVAWREGGAAYWIENTLSYSLSPQAIVTIARDTRPVDGPTAIGHPPAGSSPHGLALPTPAASAVSSNAKLAAGLGFLGLAALAPLALGLFVRRRQLNRLREQMSASVSDRARRYGRFHGD